MLNNLFFMDLYDMHDMYDRFGTLEQFCSQMVSLIRMSIWPKHLDFEDSNKSLDCKLHKALYGLKQAPEA
jgi:hypothetical protein